MGFYQLNSNANPVTLTLNKMEAGWVGQVSNQHVVAEAEPIDVNVTIQTEGGGPAQDTGSQQLSWSNTAGLPYLLQGQGQSGLTPTEATQLEQTQQATWPEHLVDQLLVTDLGQGSSTQPIAANLTSPVFGVIVRITGLPPELLPQTPDQDYWVPSLAVVRIYRGSDVWLRVPIHTSSKLINLWVEGLALGLADAVLSAGWLLNLTLQVTFLPGVTGEVLLMRVP